MILKSTLFFTGQFTKIEATTVDTIGFMLLIYPFPVFLFPILIVTILVLLIIFHL